MGKWSDELLSGNHEQTRGKLKDKEGGYCCLGVLEEHTLHIPFTMNDHIGCYVDAFDRDGYPTGKVTEKLGLNACLTADEAKYLNNVSAVRGYYDGSRFMAGSTRRMATLGYLNDTLSLSFDMIGLIVIMFGWDVEDNPNFMEEMKEEMVNG